MADIVIFVAGIHGNPGGGTDVIYHGVIRVSGMTVADDDIPFEVAVAPGASPATINNAIIAAAVAAAQAAGFSVGSSDRKTLLCGALP